MKDSCNSPGSERLFQIHEKLMVKTLKIFEGWSAWLLADHCWKDNFDRVYNLKPDMIEISMSNMFWLGEWQTPYCIDVGCLQICSFSLPLVSSNITIVISVNSIFRSVKCAGNFLVKARHRVREKDRQNTELILVKYRQFTGPQLRENFRYCNRHSGIPEN